MKAELYWVEAPGPGRVAIMPRPRGGDWLEAEIRSYRSEGVEVLVSLLEEHEVTELDLHAEGELARKAGMDFRSYPIVDGSVPRDREEAAELIRALGDLMRSGKSLAIHCRAGIGRSAVFVACVLLTQGLPLDDALARLREARGYPVPETALQLDWVERFPDSR